MTVTIDNDTALKMLLDRLEFWTTDPTVYNLYSDYYENMVSAGCFDGCEFNVNDIVDNDYINYMNVYTRDELEKEYNDVEADRIMATYDNYVLYYVA